ncbi:tyrosine decarboxylase 1-like [Olea europaea var. sylvestris]|uniref:tyrosine decarboxylase 1-like n=1 Tax=Olea europaea var. sylvestris TaxID=158386 RepID=UPI000C1CDA72|nr:tyrosine decarboxylase 1-like [Olea europaea var. sylvestris]
MINIFVYCSTATEDPALSVELILGLLVLEMIILDWPAKALKLPDEFLSTGQEDEVIRGATSEAVLVVPLAARGNVLRKVEKDAIGKLVACSSNQTHSALSVVALLSILKC